MNDIWEVYAVKYGDHQSRISIFDETLRWIPIHDDLEKRGT